VPLEQGSIYSKKLLGISTLAQQFVMRIISYKRDKVQTW